MTYPYILITTKNSELLDNLGDDGLSHFFDVKEAFEVINRENIEIKALLYDATLVQQWGKDGRTFLNIADYLEEHNIVGKFPLWIITKNKINDADFNEFLLYNLITERWEHDREQPVDYINGSFQKIQKQLEKLIGKSLGPSRYDINEAMRKLLEDNPPGNFDDQSDVEISLDTLRDEVSDEKEEQGYSIKNTYKVKNIIISKSALSAHLILEENISSYCKQAMVNNLPDGFHSLYRLSSIFRNASNIDVQNSSNGNEAQAQINSDLMKEVKELRDALEALKDTKRRNPFFDSLQTQAGKSLADWKMWGAILSASVVMAGGGLLLDYLTDIAESLEELRQKQAAPK